MKKSVTSSAYSARRIVVSTRGWDTPDGKPPPDATGASPVAPLSSVSLGPTYSAAAAQAAGQGGSGSPVEKMATNIADMRKAVIDLGLLSREQAKKNDEVVTMYQRFLAAFSYG